MTEDTGSVLAAAAQHPQHLKHQKLQQRMRRLATGEATPRKEASERLKEY